MVYRLRLMGPFELLSPDDRPIPVAAKKSQALVAMLALAEGASVPRSRLTAVLWGDRGEDQARNSLRQAFSALRKAFAEHGDFPFTVTEQVAAIDPMALRTDTAELEEDGELAGIGEFLEGLDIHGEAAEYWLRAERQRIGKLVSDRLSRRLAAAEAAGDSTAAMTAAEALLRVDPLNEPAHRALARSTAAAGDRAGALRQLRACRELLKAELGIKLDSATLALAEEIRAGGTAADPAPPAQNATLSAIAVLPFENLSADPEQEYFSDGITEDIITELTRFPSLFVIARNSTFVFKGKCVDVTEVGRRLGVGYVVEGSVRKVGARVRISAQLIEAATGRNLWAERYDRELKDIFAVQDEVVETVTLRLGQSVRDMTFGRVRGRPASGLTAYEHLLRGRAAWWNGETEDAFRHVERALAADPEYAAAHAWLALQYTYDQFKGVLDMTIGERERRALRHAEAALALDDHDAFVHMAVSMVFCFTVGGDKARALHHSDAAIALNPHDYECMYCRAYILMTNDRHREALEWFEKARRLSPVAAYLLCEGFFDLHRTQGEYQNALDVIAGQGLPLNTYFHVAVLNGCLGRWEVARSAMERFERGRPAHLDVDAYVRFLTGLGFFDASEQEAAVWLRGPGGPIPE